MTKPRPEADPSAPTGTVCRLLRAGLPPLLSVLFKTLCDWIIHLYEMCEECSDFQLIQLLDNLNFYFIQRNSLNKTICVLRKALFVLCFCWAEEAVTGFFT